MQSMERLVDVHISLQTRLRAIDHRTAHASPARDQLCRADAQPVICPSVLEPSLASKLEQDVGAEATYVPGAARIGGGAASQASGGHYQQRERIDEAPLWHRPLDCSARVVGG